MDQSKGLKAMDGAPKETNLLAPSWDESNPTQINVRLDKLRSTVVILTTIWSLLGFIGIFFSLFSVMIFDAPGSERLMSNRLGFIAMFTFPGICLIAIIGANYMMRVSKKFMPTLIFILLPIINGGLYATGLFLSFFKK